MLCQGQFKLYSVPKLFTLAKLLIFYFLLTRYIADSFKWMMYLLKIMLIVFNEYLFSCNHKLTYASDPECMFLQSAAPPPEFCSHPWAPPAGRQQSHAMLDSSCHSGQSAYTDGVPPSVGHVPAWPVHHMCSVTS